MQRAYRHTNTFPTSMMELTWKIQAIPMNYIAIYLYRWFSVRACMRIAACLQLGGAWIRSYAIVTGTFWPILAGTIVLSCSAEILWQSQNMIINKWFPVNEYGLASALVQATSVMMLVGFSVSGLVFSD